MYQDSKHTCRTIVFLIKPFVCRRSHRHSHRDLLKLPNMQGGGELKSIEKDQKKAGVLIATSDCFVIWSSL